LIAARAFDIWPFPFSPGVATFKPRYLQLVEFGQREAQILSHELAPSPGATPQISKTVSDAAFLASRIAFRSRLNSSRNSWRQRASQRR